MIEISDEMKQEIHTLYNECIENSGQFHRKLDLFLVPIILTQKIFEATKIDVSNHWVCIDNFGISHTLEHHGNPISEGKRGQIAVEKEDFITMLEVFLYPDEITAIEGNGQTKKPLLQFIRRINDKVYVVKKCELSQVRRKIK